jgi:hypothetical protein
MPTEDLARNEATARRLIAEGKTDAELSDWAKTRADGGKTDPKTLTQLMTMFHMLGRPLPAVLGAAAGGAALRQALVGQLQGDQKQEQD